MKSPVKTALIAVFTILIMRGLLMANGDITKKVLNNGVTVIIKENHAAPVAACNFWVKTGSAYENDSEKGMTHFIEHLLFKGTQKRGLGQIDKEITELGGYNNAFTTYDATNYVIVLPSEHVEKALEIEYDALTASIFAEEEVNKEREVVLTELNRGLDNPHVFTWQKLMYNSFEKYYRDPVIGYENTIKSFDRDKVVDFYSRHYTPENIIVVVAGDVDPAKTMAYAESLFGSLAAKNGAGDNPEEVIKTGDSFTYKALPGGIESRYLAVSYRIPAAVSPEMPAIEILARVLGGSESTVMHRVLKEEKQLVDEIDVDIFAGKSGGVIVFFATVREGKYAETLKELFTLIEKAKTEAVKPEVLARVKSDILREESKENMKAENMALNLGYYQMLGDYAMYDKYFDGLQRVIEKDIPKMAEKYLDKNQANLIFYYPASKEAEFSGMLDAAGIKDFVAFAPEVKTKDDGALKSEKLKNGITFIHRKLSNTDIVSAKFMFAGGQPYESAQEGYYKGITNLMMETMMKGTKTKNAEEIAGEIDALGAVIVKDISRDSFGWGLESLNSNFEGLMALFSDIVLNPSFTLAEIKKEKADIVNMINRRKDNPAGYAMKIFNETLYEWHPYGYPVAGEAQTVNRISSTLIKDWHKNRLMPNTLVVSVVGNIEYAEAKAMTEKYFGSWKKGKQPGAKIPVKITDRKKEKREPFDKNQTHMVIGFLGPKSGSPDYYHFRVLDSVLSGGMSSRLFTEVRDKRNLCYTVYSTFDRTVERGAFKIYTATSPENEQAAYNAIMEVLRDIQKNGITEDELKTAKAYINGMYKIGMQDYMGRADSYVAYEILGLGFENVEKFPENINAVTVDGVKEVINKYFNLDGMTKAVVGAELKKKKEEGK